MSTRAWVACLVLAAGAVAATAGQGVHPVTGRRIAPVMSHLGADWLDRPERAREEAPDRALDALAIRPGQAVADVGAGSGYFTERLARRVGPEGRVYAVDIQPEMLERLEARVKRAGLSNVTPLLGAEADPRLPPACCDLILMVDVYHELARPQEMLRRLGAALANDGRLVLLEYRKEDPDIPIRPEHKMSVADARAELEAEGFRLERVIDVLPRQHVLVFGLATAR
ncbi:MAG TPA: class I SAM-dependent methyltransferase [Methylomirabilota bacterium]